MPPSDLENTLLERIRQNPFVSQQTLADELGLSRSRVAALLSQLTQQGFLLGRAYVLPPPRRIVCVGGAVLDRKYTARGPLVAGSSNPVGGSRSYGGVARNVAENLGRLGAACAFISVLGDDETARGLLSHLSSVGVDVSGCERLQNGRTAEYLALLSEAGELELALADMDIFEALTPALLERHTPQFQGASWVFADCNLPAQSLNFLLERRRVSHFRLALDAVSVAKSARLPTSLEGLDLLFLNRDEAAALTGISERGDAALERILNTLHSRGVAEVVLSLGESGLMASSRANFIHLNAPPTQVIDVTGAGDALIAGTLYRLLEGANLTQACGSGQRLAQLTLSTPHSVYPNLSSQSLLPEETP